MFASRKKADLDWSRYCGNWRVGRVHENLRPVGQRIVFVWSLTGPPRPEATIILRGDAATIAEAEQQSVDAWAGVHQPDVVGPSSHAGCSPAIIIPPTRPVL
jgi:hypothetical protein